MQDAQTEEEEKKTIYVQLENKIDKVKEMLQNMDLSPRILHKVHFKEFVNVTTASHGLVQGKLKPSFQILYQYVQGTHRTDYLNMINLAQECNTTVQGLKTMWYVYRTISDIDNAYHTWDDIPRSEFSDNADLQISLLEDIVVACVWKMARIANLQNIPYEYMLQLVRNKSDKIKFAIASDDICIHLQKHYGLTNRTVGFLLTGTTEVGLILDQYTKDALGIQPT